MKVLSLKRACERAGLEVKQCDRGSKYYVECGERLLEWYEQATAVVCLRARYRDDRDCWKSDYHAGFYPGTIRHALEWIQTPEPKLGDTGSQAPGAPTTGP